MNYKVSKYTYLFQYSADKTILFNGNSKQFIVVPPQELSNYLYIIKKCNDVSLQEDKRVANYIRQLVKANILVDPSVDECQQVKDRISSYVGKDEFHTMILPTYDCNYNCWYCVQRHHKTEMSPQVVELIQKHIFKYLEEQKIPSYVLYWFGGEPLMQKEIIKKLTSKVCEYCRKNDIKFFCQITTNGALLDIPTINTLKSVHVDCYQITLDGDKNIHDKTKFDGKNVSSFDLILNNITNLLRINENANVTLRYNYTPQNIKKITVVDELAKHIPRKLRDRVKIDLQRIWQVEENKVSLEDLDLLQKKFVDNGFKLLTLGFFEPCYVEKHRFEVIYYNGKVDVCDNYAFDKARGQLMDDGNVDWGDAVEKPDFYPICLDCAYFPVCLEECPAKRLKQQESGIEFSCQEGIKKHIEYTIKDYCLRTINNKKLD